MAVMAVMAVSDQLESVEEVEVHISRLDLTSEVILRLHLTSEVIQCPPRPSVHREDNDPQELVEPAARLEGAHRDVADRHQEGLRVPGRRRRRRLRRRQESHRSGVRFKSDNRYIGLFSSSNNESISCIYCPEIPEIDQFQTIFLSLFLLRNNVQFGVIFPSL